MVKPGRCYGLDEDLTLDAHTFPGYLVIDGGAALNRSQVQELVAELIEYLAETAPKEAQK